VFDPRAEWGGSLEIDCTHERLVVDSGAIVVMDVNEQEERWSAASR